MPRRRTFRTPVVLTLAACSGSADRTSSPPAVAALEPIVDAGPRRPDADPTTRGIVFRDPVCYRETDAGLEVDSCPDAILPEPPADRLIRSQLQERAWCFIVGRDVPSGTGRVRCPEGGPTLQLPYESFIETYEGRVYLDPTELTCWKEVPGNPPSSKRMDRCPPQALPYLINGATPTTELDGCWWNDIEVACGPPPPPPPATRIADILAVKKSGKGSKLTIGMGTDDGLADQMHGHLRYAERETFVLEGCTAHTCEAKVAYPPDAIDTINGVIVVLE